MTTEEKIARVCMRIRAASPETWEELLTLLRTHVADLKDQMVAAPPENLVAARGIVVGAHGVVTKLGSAREIVERIDRTKKNG